MSFFTFLYLPKNSNNFLTFLNLDFFEFSEIFHDFLIFRKIFGKFPCFKFLKFFSFIPKFPQFFISWEFSMFFYFPETFYFFYFPGKFFFCAFGDFLFVFLFSGNFHNIFIFRKIPKKIKNQNLNFSIQSCHPS